MWTTTHLWNRRNKAAPPQTNGHTNGGEPGIRSAARGNGHCAPLPPRDSLDDVMGWLSLTSDADGHGRHENDVLCMGIIPDDLDEHDIDGSDLSWIGLIPSASTHNAPT